MALSRHERTKHKIDLNPLEMIETVVQANDWPFDRTSEKEIAAIAVPAPTVRRS